MSENFVRRNLKRKGITKYKKPSSTRRAQNAIRTRVERTNITAAEGEATNANDDSPSAQDSDAPQAGGLVAWGVDPLQLSLEHAVFPEASVSGRAKSALTALSALVQQQQQRAREALLEDPSVLRGIRGLHVLNPAARLSASRSLSLADSRSYGKDVVALLQQIAPSCSGHHMPSKLWTVNKTGGNKGRRFFGCTFPADQRCDFFLWAEDCPELLSLRSVSTAAPTGTSTEGETSFSQVDFSLSLYRERLRQMTKEQLVDEARFFNRRLSLCSSHPHIAHKVAGRSKLLVGGSREELQRRICAEAKVWISLHLGVEVENTNNEISGEGAENNIEKSQPKKPRSAGKKRKRQRKTSAASEDDISSEGEYDEMIALSDSDGDNTDDVDEGDGEDNDDYFGEELEEDGSDSDESEGADDDDEEEDEKNSDTKSDGMIELSDSEEEEEEVEGKISPTKCAPQVAAVNSAKPVDVLTSNGDEPKKEKSDYLIFLSDSEEESENEEPSSSPSNQQLALCSSCFLSPSLSSVSDLSLYLAMRYFGFSALRPGQQWAIDRVVRGQRALLVLPTGAGKSLCFTLPALALSGITIVVSPLIALIQDQLQKLPCELTACSTSSPTASTTQGSAEWAENVLRGAVKLLFVSPERLCSSSFRRVCDKLRARGREISLVAIDEAHCLSQWSLHFRPAFLRIEKVIERLRPRSVLAVTATASEKVRSDIGALLKIWGDKGSERDSHEMNEEENEMAASASPRSEAELVMRMTRNNLFVSCHLVKDEEEKRERLVALLSGAEKSGAGDRESSTISAKAKKEIPLSIVYVRRRFEAAALADSLRAALSTSLSLPASAIAVYHGGMDAAERDRVQRQFLRGNVRIVVATVAFGLGVDNHDVRRVFHSGLPRSLDAYCQEIGRAGRDGQIAQCVNIFSAQDAQELSSLSQSQRVAQSALLGLLCELFPFENVHRLMSQEEFAPRDEETVCLSLQALEKSLCLSSATIETAVTLLSLSPFSLCVVHGTHYDKITMRFRVASDELHSLCESDVVVREIARRVSSQRQTTSSETTRTGVQQQRLMERSAVSFFALDDPRAQSLSASLQQQQKQTERGERDAAMAHLSQWFSLSRWDLAQSLSLDLDETSLALFRLQRRNVCEYSMADCVLRVSYSRRALLHSLGEGVTLTKDIYLSWLLSVCEQLHTALQSSAQREGESVLQMWKAACAIHSLDELKDKDNVPAEDKAAAVQRLLSRHVLGDASVSISSLHGIDAVLEKAFASAPSPHLSLSKNTKEGELSAERAQLSQCIREVVRDQQLSVVVQRVSVHSLRILARSLGAASLSKKVREQLSVQRVALQSLCVAKVLHGLGGGGVDNVYWSASHSDVFGRFRAYPFEEILDEVHHVLTTTQDVNTSNSNQ